VRCVYHAVSFQQCAYSVWECASNAATQAVVLAVLQKEAVEKDKLRQLDVLLDMVPCVIVRAAWPLITPH